MDDHRAFSERLRPIREIVERARPREILDLGTAQGGFALALQDLAPVRAIDRRDHGWPRSERISWELSNMDPESIMGLPRFDVILALSVLHHFEDPLEGLEALRRRARKLLILEVPHPEEILTKVASKHRLAEIYRAAEAAAQGIIVETPSTRQPDRFLRSVFIIPPLLVGRAEHGGGHHSSTQQKLGDLFEEALGYRPFPGSLNVRTDHRNDLEDPHAIIRGEGQKSYRLWPAKIEGLEIPAHLMTFQKKPTRPILELLAPVCLRDHLDLSREIRIDVLAEILPRPRGLQVS
jgi:SAM-dependent methyltransferase